MSKSNGNGKSMLTNAIRRIKKAEQGPTKESDWGVDIRYRITDPNTGATDIRLVIIRSVVNKCKGKVFGGGAKPDMGDRFGENAGFSPAKGGGHTELSMPQFNSPEYDASFKGLQTQFGEGNADPWLRNKVRTRNKVSGWKGGYTGGVWGAIIGTRKGGGFFGVNLRADISPEDIVQMIVCDRMIPRIKRGEKFILCPDGIGSVPPEQGDEHLPNGFWDVPTDTGVKDPKTGYPVLNLGNLLRGWKTAVVMGVRGWYGEQGDTGSDANSQYGEAHRTETKRLGKGPIDPNKGANDPEIGEAADILRKLGGELNGVCLDILAEMTNGDEPPVSEKVQTLAERHQIGVATVYRYLAAIRERAGKLIGKR